LFADRQRNRAAGTERAAIVAHGLLFMSGPRRRGRLLPEAESQQRRDASRT
jgi:hypothetical protein